MDLDIDLLTPYEAGIYLEDLGYRLDGVIYFHDKKVYKECVISDIDMKKLKRCFDIAFDAQKYLDDLKSDDLKFLDSEEISSIYFHDKKAYKECVSKAMVLKKERNRKDFKNGLDKDLIKKLGYIISGYERIRNALETSSREIFISRMANKLNRSGPIGFSLDEFEKIMSMPEFRSGEWEKYKSSKTKPWLD